LAKAEQKYVIAVTPAPAVDLVNAQPFIQPIPIQRTVSVHSGSFLDQQAVLDADLTWLTVSAWYLRVLTDRSASPAIWVSEPWSATASTPDSFALDVPAAWVAKYYEKSDAKKFLRMNSSSDLSRTYLLHGSLYAGTKDHVDPTAAVTSLRSQHPVLVKLSKQYEGSLTPVLRQQYAERLTFLYAQLDAIEKGTPACC
jgi:hypothetical protein